MQKLTQNHLKSVLEYNHLTGIFKWKQRLSPIIKIGEAAGTIDCHGYIRIQLNKKKYKAHRLAFLYMNGFFPENEVDHINRIKTDNRWENLRNATRHENANNQENIKKSDNGVSWCSKSQKWRAQRKGRSNENRNLGYYKTHLAASYARHANEVINR